MIVINTTAVTWYFTAIVSTIVAYRFFIGWKKTKNFFASRFSAFFFFIAISFLFLGSSWISEDYLYLKTILFLGHFFLWIGFAVLGEVVWQIKWREFPILKWLASFLILTAGFFELFLQWNCLQIPKVVQFNKFFSVTQVQLCFSDFVALTVISLFLSVIMGIIFFQEALKMKGIIRIRTVSMGLIFILASAAGSLTTFEQAPIFLAIEDIVVIIGFSIVLILSFSSSRLTNY